MSILDLRGPEFLKLYAFLLLALIAAGVLFRWLMSGPHDDGHPSHEPDLDPLEVAYLAGGAKSATDAAIAALVHRDVVTVRGSAPPKLQIATALPGDATPLECAVYDSIERGGDRTIREVRKDTAETAERLTSQLERYEYILDPMRRQATHVVPIVALVALLVLGIVKIGIGFHRDRPVGFLFGLTLLTFFATLIFAAYVPLRTRRGSRLLKRMKSENVALQAQALAAPSALPHTDLAFAFSLYGPAVLSMGPLAPLQTAIKPPSSGGSGCGGSSGSSCGGGSSGCGGGGCGGGCGGCGG